MSIGQKISKIVLVGILLVSNRPSDTFAVPMAEVEIHVTSVNAPRLAVSFELASFARRLYFRTSSDQSRETFWKATSPEFELVQLSGGDVIQRVDGKPFQAVSFEVGLVDISLPNYYRPFSPLYNSENGVVVHTGQFFVCIDRCTDGLLSWQVDVTAPNMNLVHFDGTHVSTASWLDHGDGRSFYIGPLHTTESDSLMAIVDPGLPDTLKTLLELQLPSLVDRLATEFSDRQTKPLVFATYNFGDPERRGFQGGVLNKTVFMHWWGPNLEQRIDEQGELWFMAHEIAHFYQSRESDVDVDEVAWIHEGFAELIAATVLAQGSEQHAEYAGQRFRSAKSACGTGLESTPLGAATRLKQFDLHYQCGLLLHHFIVQHAKVKVSVFELWNRYRAAINTGEKPSRATYLRIVKPLLSNEDFLVLQTIVESKLASQLVVQNFLGRSIF